MISTPYFYLIPGNDITKVINVFQSRNYPTDRYASFDYCYNYFKSNSGTYITQNMEKSCLMLGFYLASWGMLRGSSFLLQKSAKYYEPLIDYIARQPKSTWSIDIDNMLGNNLVIVLDIYKDIRKIIGHNNSHLTLVTKIMLGVFGFIPAFDQYFGIAFRGIFEPGCCRFRRVNTASLTCLHRFYIDNKQEIDFLAANTFTRDFITGNYTTINYPKAKIIDMYGFQMGLAKATPKGLSKGSPTVQINTPNVLQGTT